MTTSASIIERVEIYMSQFLKTEIAADLYFHNIIHTREVVEAVTDIGIHEGLNADELEPLKVAGWFHDAGYCCKYLGHEDESIRIARAFLSDQDYPVDKVSLVISCIEATRYPQKPQDLYAEILCDADLYHFSCKDYNSHEQNLRKEWAVYLNKQYTDQQWVEENCYLLSIHNYFTRYGKEVLQAKKEQNMIKMLCR
jgi:predicted metal-dependent HD superfamily phosphohydrolase